MLIIVTLTVLFQGQYYGHVFNDDDPAIEQPTLESFMSYNKSKSNSVSVVTINDFDNFDIGVDNWEQHATTNPNNPCICFSE